MRYDGGNNNNDDDLEGDDQSMNETQWRQLGSQFHSAESVKNCSSIASNSSDWIDQKTSRSDVCVSGFRMNEGHNCSSRTYESGELGNSLIEKELETVADVGPAAKSKRKVSFGDSSISPKKGILKNVTS